MSVEASNRMREFACPHCGVGVGERCVTRSGRPAAYEHSDRYYLARRAGRLPIVDRP